MALCEIGKPVPLIIQEKRNGPFVLQEEALKSLLLCHEVKDKPVCVVAIAGAFRTGKSFLLNFFRRYCLNRDRNYWLDEGARPSDGFIWKQGDTRETTGIMAWSKPLICKIREGEEESTVVFALTAMISSILIYNLSNNIQENHLSDLQTFMVYGKSVAAACGSSQAFQSVLLLVRDWQFPNQKEYGYAGGQILLDKILKVDPKQAVTQQETRKDIKKCFSDIKCYLMPHPGTNVNTDANFTGRPHQMIYEFKDHLRQLVPSLLHPDKLVKKRFKGEVVHGQQLFYLFKNFVNMIKEMDLPEPFAFAEAAARSSSETARDAAMAKYKIIMQKKVYNSVCLHQLELWHLKAAKEATEVYFLKNKIGEMRERIFKNYQDSLEKWMKDLYKRQRELVQSKTENKRQEQEREKERHLETQKQNEELQREMEDLKSEREKLREDFRECMSIKQKELDIEISKRKEVDMKLKEEIKEKKIIEVKKVETEKKLEEEIKEKKIIEVKKVETEKKLEGEIKIIKELYDKLTNKKLCSVM